jgi:hypothetical protein
MGYIAVNPGAPTVKSSEWAATSVHPEDHFTPVLRPFTAQDGGHVPT